MNTGIELQLTADDAHTGYHQGACDDDITVLRREPAIAKQLEALDPAAVRNELREYGVWDDDELADHEDNLDRLLWLACGDTADVMSE